MNKETLKRYLSDKFVLTFIFLSLFFGYAAYELYFSDVRDVSKNKSTIPIDNEADNTNTLAEELKRLQQEEQDQLAKEEAERLKQEEAARLKQEEAARIKEEEEKKKAQAAARAAAAKKKAANTKPVVPQPVVPQPQYQPPPQPQFIPTSPSQSPIQKKSRREWNDSPIEFMSYNDEAIEDSTAVDPKYSPLRIQDRNAFGRNTGNNDLRYVVMQEQKIPAIIEDRITTDAKNGRWVGRILENVYGRHGNIILIPQSSTVLGLSGSFSAASGRLDVSIIRIVTPGGDIIFQAGEGYDQDGAKGIVGELDNRYWERYVIPAIMSVGSDVLRAFYLNYVSSWLESSGNDATMTAITLQSIVNSSEKMSNAVIQDVIRRQLAIEPVIVLERGTKIQLMLMQDVLFEQNS